MPILGRYGPYFLTSYFVILSLGTLIALAATAYHARRLYLSSWLDGVLLSGGAALAAGRIVFVILNRAYFTENPGKAWAIWQGGINFQAALIAGLLAYIAYLHLTNRPISRYLDLIAPGLAILMAAGWVACWFEGCAYGRETIAGLFAADLPDDFGVMAVRYQTQAIGFLCSAVIAGLSAWQLSDVLPGETTTGRLFWLTLAALTAVQALLTFWRGDPAPIWFGLRADFLVDIIVLTVSLIAAARSGPSDRLAD